MKCIFQEGIGTTSGKDIWLKQEDIFAQEILEKVKAAYDKNRSCYHTTHFIQNNISYFPFLFIDLDSPDLNKCKTSAIKIVEYFKENGISEDSILIAFSGSKGFHIILDNRVFFSGNVPTRDDFSHIHQKEFVKLVAQECLSEDDVAPDYRVYSKSRKIRTLFSKHHKTSLFKIPLSLEDLKSLSILEVQERSKRPSIQKHPHLDGSLSFFCNEVYEAKMFGEMLDNAKESSLEFEKKKEKKDKNDKKKKERKDKTFLKGRIGDSDTRAVALGCRAVRQAVFSIIDTENVEENFRGNIARALYPTAERDSFVTNVLKRDKRFSYEKTVANLAASHQVNSCEGMIESGFCKKECNRYLNSDNSPANTPLPFGKIDLLSNWDQVTSPEYIESIANKLINYHETTTDLFDWVNAKQYIQNSEVFSHAISDYLKKGKIPSFKNYIVPVKKDNSRYRDLSYVHFEYELLLSIFVELGLKSNYRYKKKVTNDVVLSYGYQDFDTDGRSLLRSWQGEYRDYKRTLDTVANSGDWKLVYSDDIKSFYPSFSISRIQNLINSIFKDDRVKETLQHLYVQPFYDYQTGESLDKHYGLSQGPLLSHVIAARSMLELDAIITNSFSRDEIRVVRYCDDVVFFMRDESVLEKLTNEVIPEIERRVEIAFHKDESSGKTYKSTNEDYIKERLADDLYKYQVKFESELAALDPESKKRLVKLIKEIFGNTLDKFLSNDQLGNIKELERGLNTLRWKVPKLFDDDTEIMKDLKSLCERILNFIRHENVSHKLRSNLTALLLSLLENYSDKFEDVTDDFIDLFNSNTLSNDSVFCFTTQLHSFFTRCANSSLGDRLKKIEELLNEERSNVDLFKRLLIPGLSYIRSDFLTKNGALHEQLWEPSRDRMFPNLSSYVKEVKIAIDSGIDSLRELFLSCDSSAIFYSKFVHKHILKKYDELTLKEKCDFFRFSQKFCMKEIELLFISDLPELIREGLLTDSEVKIVNEATQYYAKIVNESFGLECPKLYVVKRVNDINLYSSNENFFIIKTLSRVQGFKVSLEQVNSIVSEINFLNVGSIKIYEDNEKNEHLLVYKLPESSHENHWKYLDKNNKIEDIVDAEMSFFRGIGSSKLPQVVLSAKNLGLFSSNGEIKIYYLRPEEIIKDTINKVYVNSDNTSERIKKVSRSVMPEIRVYDFLFYFNDRVIIDVLGRIGWRLLKKLDPQRRESFFYSSPEIIVKTLGEIADYRHWLFKDSQNEEIDNVKDLIYQIFDWNNKNPFYVNKPTNKRNVDIYSNLLKIQTILEGVTTEFDEGKVSLAKMFQEITKYEKVTDREYLTSDYLLGYLLCLSSYRFLHHEKDITNHEVIFIGIFGLGVMQSSLEEVQIRDGSDLYSDLVDYVADSRIVLFKMLKTFYPHPIDGVSSEVVEKYLSIFEGLKTRTKRLNTYHIRNYKIHPNSHFSPAFSSDGQERLREISQNFHRIDFIFRERASGVVSHLVDFVNTVMKNEKFHEQKLKEVLSSNHRWSKDTNEYVVDQGLITKMRNGHVLFIYPKYFRLLPKKTLRLLGVREHRLYKVIAFLILSFICFIFSDVKIGDIVSFIKKFLELFK